MATTVVTNPVGPAGPGSQNPTQPGRGAPRPSWVASHTPVQAKRAVEHTSRFFRANPWQSTAVVLSVVSLAANIIALFSPWLTWSTGKFTWTGGEQEWYGQATLLDVKVCKTFTEPADVDRYTASKSCTIWLQSNGPAALNWMTHVGGAAFAMLILALVANVLAFWLTYLRRIGALKSLPAFAARLRDWLVSASRGWCCEQAPFNGMQPLVRVVHLRWRASVSSHSEVAPCLVSHDPPLSDAPLCARCSLR